MPPQVEETAPPVVEPEKQEKSGLGPMPAVTKFGDKFRAEMAKVEAATPPIEPPPEPTKPPTPDATETTEVPETKTDTSDKKEDIPVTKPESPLDVIATEKKEEVPIVDPDTSVEDLSKIAVPKSEHWRKARETMDAQKKLIAELKSAPKPAPEIELTAKRIEELQAEVADRDARIKAINAEYSPEYQKLVGKYQGTAEKIRTRMASFGADGDSLLAALSMPYSKARTDQIDTALAELDGGKQGRIQSLIEELEGQAEEIGEFRKDLPAKYDEIVAAQQQHAVEQHQNALKQLETEFVKISEILPDDIVTLREVPEDVPGGTEWNKEIQEARTNALRVLKPDGADFNESVQVALKGARYDSLEKRYLALHKDYTELKKHNARMDSSEPDFKGTPKPTTKQDQSRGVKYREALAQRIAAGDDQ